MRSSNVQFESLPASVSGFTRIDINDVKPGDLVIRHDDKGGNHAMMYDSTDKNG
ncbi:hypothetical protein [Intestinibacter sp.]|uniref:hypothetical protein n=1 Tax=Intestinibacter sp. TaxID=1965304 RepID=UPI003F13D51A